MKNLKILVLIVLAFFAGTNVSPAQQFKQGKWQTIIDGQSGEGAFFYRLHFMSDNVVEITQQKGGLNTITEQKRWDREGNKIVITDNDSSAIAAFDGSTLTITDENTLIYNNPPYEGKVKPYQHGLAILHWVLILVVLIILNELFRKSKWASIIFFLVLPVVLSIFVWPNQGVTYWFKWVKVYSVVFASIWFIFIRYSKHFGKHNWVKLIAAMFLAVNIMEAVSQDFSMGHLPNVLNGIAGVLSTITLFYGWKKIGPDNSKEKDMVWPGMPILWIIAYDVWNIVYVYLNFPGSTSAQLMVLLSCTIPALFIKKGTWLQARAFTLAAWFMYYFTFPRFTEQLELMVPRNNTLMLTVALLSIVLNVVYFGVFIKKIAHKRSMANQ
ncbi:MAG: DUF5692 family protein [Salinivirgaceae bacterium]|jgi:hypothetical protein|nr:DUF5692 family protein [Salinivirgaceae bacterium]